MSEPDVIILGAGAAGLMCAIEAARCGQRVLILEKAKKPAEKIRISGGGRCNFTNVHTSPANYLSENPHFCRSALARFTPTDFLSMVEAAGIEWHEKTLGQLFCTEKGGARLIIDMLLDACRETGLVDLKCEQDVAAVDKTEHGFTVQTQHGAHSAAALVVATGGPSIPKMGATGFGYDIARQFGLNVIEPTPALVPFTLSGALLDHAASLSGVGLPVIATCGKTRFEEALLFTHRGLSGPAILQISSYWQPGDEIEINLLPYTDLAEDIKTARTAQPKQTMAAFLGQFLPARLATQIAAEGPWNTPLGQLPSKEAAALCARIHHWRFRPTGTEGYRTAEVTRGGVSTAELSSKTMEAKAVPGLYFIGEVVDVTGHLGGFNFQWAWASGYASGHAVGHAAGQSG